MVPLMAWRVKVLKSGYILKCNDFHLCAKVFVNFTMVYIFTFGKLAYIILQSNVDIISKNFPKKKKTIQVFMDLGILSYNLWRVEILNHFWGSTLTVYIHKLDGSYYRSYCDLSKMYGDLFFSLYLLKRKNSLK